ncbi:MAG: HU family DNA-binding protein, partial [Oscillospiraceae bacterium]|nr:HU family DNA-binding protein [Oscillospiraceae bacterium]
KARNPRTGEPIDIAESKAVSFKPGKGLRDALVGED